MELAAFQAEATATGRTEERWGREARWKVEDDRSNEGESGRNRVDACRKCAIQCRSRMAQC